MAIQTFGDYCRWHPHIHAIVSDGLYTESGYFFVMPRSVDLLPLKEMFRARVLAMLKKEGLVDDAFIRMIMQWRHTSGFSVHNQVRIARDDTKGQEALAQYIIRNPFSLEKVSYQQQTGQVIYRSKMTHGRNKKNFEIFMALDFIAAITQHIPDQSFQLVRYYGWYSNRMRGDRKKRKAEKRRDESEVAGNIEIIDIADYRPIRIPSPMWRECVKKIWEVDPLSCPRCHAEMKIISFIVQPDVIRKILVHLELWEEFARRRPPPLVLAAVKSGVASGRTHEPFDDGWPGYEEPGIDVHSL
ncbi:MAG: hypothetical protein Kow00111_28770 [Thermincola ferriacetica]